MRKRLKSQGFMKWVGSKYPNRIRQTMSKQLDAVTDQICSSQRASETPSLNVPSNPALYRDGVAERWNCARPREQVQGGSEGAR
jgi:hypothetical protein